MNVPRDYFALLSSLCCLFAVVPGQLVNQIYPNGHPVDGFDTQIFQDRIRDFQNRGQSDRLLQTIYQPPPWSQPSYQMNKDVLRTNQPQLRPNKRNLELDFGPNDRTKGKPENQVSNCAKTIGSYGRSRENSFRKALLGLQNPILFGGDILLKTDQRKSASRLVKFERSALVSSVSLWPDGLIPYELDQSVEHIADMIWSVMQLFHLQTCVKFVPRTKEPDYIRIEALKGCFSYIGRIGGEQMISLGDGCEHRGTIAHELLHAVGFYHHQNRSDRDDYIEILWENIARGKENQFLKMAPHENLLLNDFDYDSVMLYGPRTFGKTLNKVTMKPKREGVIMLEIIEKQGMSALDIDSVNKLYGCAFQNVVASKL